MKKTSFEDLLPDEECVLKRAKIWSEMFDKYETLPDNEEESVLVTDIPDKFKPLKEESAESISPSEFEDKEHDDDPDFDVENVFSQTMPLIEKRKRKWKQNGTDDMLKDFFYRTERQKEKVSNWLLDDTNMFNENSSKLPNICLDQFMQEKKVVVEEFSDEQSLDSVDTGKYILSNRKNRKMRVVTKTIQQYRYGTRKTYDVNYIPRLLQIRTLNNSKSIEEPPKYSQKQQRRSKYKRYRPAPQTNYMSDTSSTSSSTLDEKPVARKTQKRRKVPMKKSRLSNLHISSDETENVKSNNTPSNCMEISEIIFREDEVVNSTELKCPAKSKVAETPRINSTNRLSCGTPIVLHTPQDSARTCRNKLIVNEEYLEQVLGREIKDKFLGNCKNFVREVDSNSKLVFIPPVDQASIISESEEDILERSHINQTGRLIEYVHVNNNNNS